jgi:hypothetical protein
MLEHCHYIWWARRLPAAQLLRLAERAKQQQCHGTFAPVPSSSLPCLGWCSLSLLSPGKRVVHLAQVLVLLGLFLQINHLGWGGWAYLSWSPFLPFIFYLSFFILTQVQPFFLLAHSLFNWISRLICISINHVFLFLRFEVFFIFRLVKVLICGDWAYSPMVGRFSGTLLTRVYEHYTDPFLRYL